MARTVAIRTPFITLGQLLKLLRVIGAGGQAAAFLSEHDVSVNGARETRRGRKLYGGDEVCVDGLPLGLVAAAPASGAE